MAFFECVSVIREKLYFLLDQASQFILHGMAVLTFFFGLLLGITVCLGRQYQTNRKLKQTLISSPDNDDRLPSLPMTSLVRREIKYHYQQRQELEESLRNWRNLLEQAPVGYLHIDSENRLLWANQTAIQLLKIDRWQPGQPIRLLLELVRSYELDRLIEATRKLQYPQMQEWVFYSSKHNFDQATEESQEVSLRGSAVPLPNKEVGVFLENRQELVELIKLRDRAFSDLTHELRTPLTSIRLVAEALQQRTEGSERRWVEQLLREVNRLIDLVQDFTEIGNLESNLSAALDVDTLELRSLILSVWETLKPLSDSKELTLDYSGANQVFCPGDESRLTQVFLNLLDNSIKYSPVQGTIRVEITITPATAENFPLHLQNISLDTYTQNWVCVSFIDSGSGFNPADLPHVFDRLYRGDTSRQRSTNIEGLSTQGSGLGLAIVKQIVNAHGGEVSAQNHPETGGAWLQIKLPS